MQALDRLAGVCRLEHSVWIDDLEQLACNQDTQEGAEAAYVLVNLDGEVSRRLVLPEGKRFDALTYVREQNALIFRERWDGIFGGREKSSIWVHNIESGENLRLARNRSLGSSVVYTDF